ncbi:unnamed protein product, partial [Phaeothamnion confervicola]
LRSEFAEHQRTACAYRTVKCPLGCGTEMEEVVASAHAMMQCELRSWTCACGAVMRHRDRERHETADCLERVVACALCGEGVMVADRPEHDADLCPMRPWGCDCGAKVPLQNRAFHERHECQDRVLPCLNGCGFAGRRAARARHDEEPCSLTPSVCACGDLVLQRDLEQHRAAACEMRPVPCSACGARVPLAESCAHATEACPARAAPCPRGCGKALLAVDLAQHLAGPCPRRPVLCGGCGREVPVGLLDTHHKSMCQVVPCSFCQRLVLAEDLDGHANECSSRPAPCARCSETVPLATMQAHLDGPCGARTVKCNACGQEVEAREAVQHTANACPERVVRCGRGCGQRMKLSHRGTHEARSCLLN